MDEINVKTSLRQARAAMVAEFSFKQRLERIEWEENTLKPKMVQLEVEAARTLEIPRFVIDYEDNNNNSET